jgi:hypothetical protein
MENIKCPHCHEVFKVDEASFADIVKQVRDHEFATELQSRLEQAEQAKNVAIELAEAKLKNEQQLLMAQKEQEIARLNAEKERFEIAQTLKVNEAVKKIEKERDDLKSQIEINDAKSIAAEALLKEKHTQELNLKEAEIKFKDEEIALRKDLKAKLSTKMIGQSLEDHCENEFNAIRSTAFPNSYFEKDNNVQEGSKGDFIFRELDDSGNEIISIMFEMKNEADEGDSKKKNEDFFKKLDKDRTVKNCEYAVLVSLLEPENESYNRGISVVYKYPKMFVVRPQFFIPIISLLRNAAMNSMKYKTELAAIKEQNIDITNFEKNVEDFKVAFAKNYKNAGKRFKSAIDEIDKSIKALNQVKEDLQQCENHLRLANDKTDDLTIKKLTRNNSTMKKMFEDLANDGSMVEVVE